MSKDDEKVIEEAKDIFQKMVDAEGDNRKEAQDDLRFARLGEQWDSQDAKERAAEGRPCLTVNRMPSFIRQVVNDSRLNKPSIKCHPVDSNADPETAEILNGLIRNIEVQSNADQAYDTAIDFAASGGFGYVRVNVDYAMDDTFEQDILIERVSNPFTVYGDPHATSADGSDWNCCIVTENLTDDEFEAKYKGAEKVNWQADYDDIEDDIWRSEDSVRVAEYWKREEVEKELLLLQRLNGETMVMHADEFKKQPDILTVAGWQIADSRMTKTWEVTQRIVTGAEVLETNEWPGRYIPIIPVYGEEVNVDGKRHLRSLIRDAKDAQRMYNYWRTTTTELVALAPKAPWVGAAGAFDSDPNWETANTVSHPYLEYDKVDGAPQPQRQPFSGPPAGALQEALNAADDMKSILGLYDAALGARSNETSGVAIMARQREGDVSTFHFTDNLSRAISHAGRIIVDLIPKVYSTARMVRVLGEDDAPENVPVNQPVPVMDEAGQPRLDAAGKPLTRVYDLTTGKYDVTVSSGPSFTSRREEAATQMIELLRAFPQAAPLIGDLLAKNLDWPGADEIAKRLETLLPQNLQGGDNPQVKQMAAQIENLMEALKSAEADKSVEFEKLRNETEKLRIEAFRAETDRMKAIAESATAQPVPVPTPESLI